MTGILKLISDISYVSLDWHAYETNTEMCLHVVTATTNIPFLGYFILCGPRKYT